LVLVAGGLLGLVALAPRLVRAGAPPTREAAAEPTKPLPSRHGRFTLDCAATGRDISPLIYGTATWFADDGPQQWTMGSTARRWGGNATSRYNWAHGNAWSLNHNWFFRNSRVRDAPGFSYDAFLEENRAHGVKTALTVPMLGWVAKDSTSYSFPVSVFGPQQQTAWDLPDAGNGLTAAGKPIPPGSPTATSLSAPPEFVERWVRKIRADDAKRGRTVHQYILDNEPMLWHRTHRDVHPEPATYDELLERTLAYAAAVRRADPEAVIAGPAAWGWLEYHFSARDSELSTRLRPDRLLHGNQPLLPWYLEKVREHETRTHTRLLDVVDVHFYPAMPALGVGTEGGTDPATAALRLRSTRSLWDASYLDESWIKERIRLLPLLRQWVEQYAPGLKISIGEWNFGAEGHMSGGLAVAEALGRFGVEGVDSAFYWTYPPDRSPAYWAFRAYRNFDGAGGRLLDRSVPVRAEGTLSSVFASRDAGGRHVVAVLLNLDPRSPLEAHLDLGGCGSVRSARAFTYAGGPDGFVPLGTELRAGTVAAAVAPYTITVLDLALASPP
jgi:hypothetical protein